VVIGNAKVPRALLRRASWPFVASMVLVGVGLAGGQAFDAAPARPIVERGGYRVVEADFHAHTAWSDGSLSPFGVVRQAARRGLDVVAITEHNTVLPSRMAALYATATRGPVVVSGEEVTTARFHLIALGIASTVAPARSPAQVIEDVHAQHGVVVAAHPVERYWPALEPVREQLDGAEVMHPVAYSKAGGWRVDDMARFRDGATRPLAAIGSSDYHWGSVLGLCRTLVFLPRESELSAGAVLDAVRAHRTVTLDLQGQPIGDADLVELLRREPYLPRTSDWTYQGAGTLDRITRALGFLGVLGVALLRPRRRRARPSAIAGSAPPGAHRADDAQNANASSR